MHTKNRSKSKNKPRTVDEIIDEIEERTTDGAYIFRGESQCYEKVSSNLYRELQAVKVKYTDINDVQAEIADAAKAYTNEESAFEILTALQHYGGKTNLIDFTTNYKIALFFSCYGHPDKTGRVIILQKTEAVKKMLKYPQGSVKRAIDQDSVFIQPPDGFIEPDNENIINIPKDLKLLILEYLREHTEREISPKTIYNDIHGFISSQNDYWMAYKGFYEGLSWKDEGDKEKVPEEKQRVYQKTIEHYTKALELDLQQPAIYNNRGNTYAAIGEIDKAINDLSKAIELKPDYANAYNNRGDAYSKKGKIAEAINDFNFAIQLQPELAEAYNNRGVAYREIDNLLKALDDYNTAIQLKPDFTEAYNNRGNVYRNTGDLPRAFNDYNTAIRLKPDFAGAYNNRGVAYGIKGQVEKAIEDFNKAIGLNPAYADAYCNRGNAYLLKGEFDKAIEDYSRSMKHAPKDAMSYSNRGVAYLRKGEFDKTIEDASAAVALDEKLSNAYYNRAEAWLHLKEWDKAKTDLTTAKKLGMDIVATFHNAYRDVATFERRNSVKLPKDIVAMLRQYPVNSFTTTQRVLTAEGKTQESYAVLELLEKFRNTGKPLSEYLHGKSSRGITTGCNEAFIVERATRDALITEHPSSAEVLKPFLMARDIQRWRVKPIDESRREAQDKWLIFTHRGIEINAYPAIKKHLGKYRGALEKRSGKQEWYELQTAPADTARFTQSKCIFADMASETAFAFDDEGYYVGSPASLLPTSELWLLGVLNTRAVSWFYARTAPQIRGPFLKFVPRYVSQIPIPDMEPEQKALIHKIVEYILYLKKQPTTDGTDAANASDYVMVAYFGQFLDALVYELYLPDELHQWDKYFFKYLLDENLPRLEDIYRDKMPAFRELFEHLFHKDHPVRRNHFFLDSLEPIRIIESKKI